MRKSAVLITGLAILLAAPSRTGGQSPANSLKVHFLNVGQADAIYVECPDGQHNMLIDSGDVTAMRYPGSPKLFQDQLKTLLADRTRIDLVVSTHPHSDHAGSLLWVLNTYEVGTFIDDGVTYSSATYKNIEQRATELSGQGKLTFLHATALPNAGPEANFCPSPTAQTVLLKPNNFGTDANPNNNSVVIRLKYGTEAFLFTGDAETERVS